jgi:hypothetical protein
MTKSWRFLVKSLGAFFMVFGINSESLAQAEPRRDKLMVVLRESIGANKKEEALKSTGKATATLPDGRKIEFEMAMFEFIGDMHIRFVFDEPTTMRGATPPELTRLGLSTTDALALAVSNIKREYGEPEATPWTAGVMQVSGKSPDLDSSYFLDRAFWQRLNRANPDGIVVAVPKRGALLYAPLSDTKAVEALRKGIASLFATSGSLRVSSALYLFKDNSWSVFQEPSKQD